MRKNGTKELKQFDPFRTTWLLLIKNLSLFNILLTLSHKLQQFLFRYQHVSRFGEDFGDTGVPTVFKPNTSFLVG